MAHVKGRTIHATTPAERAILHKLGLESLRVSRRQNPYSVARRLKRASMPHPDVVFLDQLVMNHQPRPGEPVVPTELEQAAE